ncbi:hypothetical protein lerEdw1_009772 [Lerista edwardsae]|nr:hypothetical protein lerEdw1_009772 [Lerista edwardsae]
MKFYVVATFLLLCLLSLQGITAARWTNVGGNVGGGAHSRDDIKTVGDNPGTISSGSSERHNRWE